MKIHDLFLYVALVGIVVIWSACSEDKGNYDYAALNEVSIDSIGTSYMREAGADIYINPGVRSLNEEMADLSYSWTIDGEEVSKEKILDITLPPLSYQNHLCALTVTDNISGMQYRWTFNLSIVNPFNFGYYFLTMRDDNSTEMAYIQAVTDDNTEENDDDTAEGATLADVRYVTGCGDYSFGNIPFQIYGVCGYTSDNVNIKWNITFLTEEGENEVITTDNVSFLPISLINSSSFMEPGYEFKPEAFVVDQMRRQYFVSNGQYIRCVDGRLYRPALHNGEYYWSNPACGASGANFAWVYDKLSSKYYVIRPYATDNIEAGIIADPYAFDQVIEPENNPVIKGTILYVSDTYVPALGGHDAYIYTADGNEIHVYNFAKTWNVDNPEFKEETVLQVDGMNGAPAFARGTTGFANNQWFLGVGDDIYYSATSTNRLSLWLTLPAGLDLGEIKYIGFSALAYRMVVVLYDENSTEERKGSVLFIDMETKEITHTFPHILHRCVSYLGANGPSNPYYPAGGDNL